MAIAVIACDCVLYVVVVALCVFVGVSVVGVVAVYFWVV